MKTTLKGLIEIAAHEGIVAMPYRDVKGIWTFGIGHTKAAGKPDPAELPKGEAAPMEAVFDVFRRDIARFEERVNRLVRVPLAAHEFDALVSFDYNTGGLNRADLLVRLNAGDRAGAADGFMGWTKPAAIIPRRTKELRLFRDGVYSANGFANVYTADKDGRVQWKSGRRVNVESLLGKQDNQPVGGPQPPDDASGYTPVRERPPAPSPGGWLAVLIDLILNLLGRRK